MRFYIVALLIALSCFQMCVCVSVNETVQDDLIKDELELMNESETLNKTNAGNVEQEDTAANSTSSQTSKRRQYLAMMVRVQLKKEIRKLKSSIADSIMEEVINYYGKKLDSIDSLKEDVAGLNEKIGSLNMNVNSLGQNLKTISRNHRNLVDVVRNNLLSKSASSQAKSSPVRNVSTVSFKKKSVEPSSSDDMNLLKAKIKAELMKELESKYSDLRASQQQTTMPTTTTTTSTTTRQATETTSDSMTEYSFNINSRTTPNDCQDIKNEGIVENDLYEITTSNTNKSMYVYCEFENNIGWTVIQRRFDGSISFYQNWNAYKTGFGNLDKTGEFWLGLDNMHALSTQRNYTLQIEMTDWRDETYLAEYDLFRVDDEKSKYKLKLGAYRKEASNAGDSFGDELNEEQSHNGMPFSTYDNDNDMRFYDNCAQLFKSGWWFNQCFNSNLNGIYYHYSSSSSKKRSDKSKLVVVRHQRQQQPQQQLHEENPQLRFLRNGIHWNTIDFYKSLKTTKMRIAQTASLSL